MFNTRTSSKLSFSLKASLLISICFTLFLHGCGDNESKTYTTVQSIPTKPCIWSIGSYPGWIQHYMLPGDIDYTPWTHILHFAMYPSYSGRLGNGEISDSEADAAVLAGHSAGVPVVLVVGGEGYGEEFVIATNENNRSQFIRDILYRITNHGYDGVSVDWEENVAGNEEQLIYLIRELRIALDTIDTNLLLLIDVTVGLVPPSVVAQIESDVDSINIMSYWDEGVDQVDAYLASGIPASKIVLGIGLSYDYYDLTTQHVENKISIVKQRNLRGLESWAMHDIQDWSDPRLEPLRELVADTDNYCS